MTQLVYIITHALSLCAPMDGQEANIEEAKKAARNALKPLAIFTCWTGVDYGDPSKWGHQIFSEANKIYNAQLYKESRDFICTFKRIRTRYYFLGDKIPTLTFADPFGFELKRYLITSQDVMNNSIKDFLKLYADKKIFWNTYELQEETAGKLGDSELLIYYFEPSDSKITSKIEAFLSNKLFTRFRWNLVFAKKKFEKGGATEKKYGVTKGGSILLAQSQDSKINVIKRFEQIPGYTPFYNLLESSLKK